MKTVLHVITGLNDGGAEGALFQLCRHDDSHRHEVISMMGPGKYGPLLQQIGVRVTCLGMPRGRVTLSGLRRLWRRLRAVRPDAIQTWMYHANLIGGVFARLAGHRNVVWGIHHSDLGHEGTLRRTVAVARLAAWLSYRLPRAVVCCAVRSANVHAAFGYDPARLVVVPNGYDLSVFRPDPASRARLRAEWNIPDDASAIGFVARYDPLKDHANLLAALAKLKGDRRPPTCLLVGTGMEPGNAELMNLIERLGLENHMRLLGRREDIPCVMNALDLHVMSSTSEAFPNVLSEAMACGTPCVSTDVGDAGEILGETGWVVPRQDPAALADAIATALDESRTSAWKVRQRAARHRVESRFSVARMAENYGAVWAGGPLLPVASHDLEVPSVNSA